MVDAVLYGRRATQSLPFVPFRHVCRGESVLTRLLVKLGRILPADRIWVVFDDPEDHAWAQANTPDPGIRLLNARYRPTNTIAETVAAPPGAVMMWLPWPALLAPSRVLAALADVAREAPCDWCEVTGLPAGTEPCLVSGRLFRTLAAAAPTDLAGNLISVARRAMAARARTATGREGADWRPREPLATEAIVGAPSGLLPSSIHLSYPWECEVLDGADRITGLNDETWTDPYAGLVAWHASAAAYEASLRRSCPRGNVGPGRHADARLSVLFVSHSCGFSGAEESLCLLAAHLPREEFRTSALVGMDGMLAERLRAAGVETIVAGRNFADPSFESLRLVEHTCATIAPDIVHLNGHEGLPILAAARRIGARVVQHARNGRVAPLQNCVGGADAIIAVSRFVERELLKWPLQPDTIVIIHDEVDVTAFTRTDRRQAMRASLGLDPEQPVMLNVARFAPNKRHDVLVKALAILAERVPAVKCILKGEVFDDASWFERIRGMIDANGLQDIVQWIPFVSDIRGLFECADVFVLCSDAEALGRSVVEAMAIGVPVVVTDSGGTHEIVDDRRTGIVVRGGDATELARGLEKMLMDRPFAERCAAAAKAFVTTELNAERTAARVASIYRRLVDTTPHTSARYYSRKGLPVP